jgi:hypothetical protein
METAITFAAFAFLVLCAGFFLYLIYDGWRNRD